MSNWEIGHTYNFSTIAPNILGDSYQEMTLVAVANYDLVTTMGYDVAIKHKQIYGINNHSTVYKDASTYDYLIFKNKNNVTVILGKPWIDEITGENQYGIDATITIKDIAYSDINSIVTELSLLGYSDIKIIKNNS